MFERYLVDEEDYGVDEIKTLPVKMLLVISGESKKLSKKWLKKLFL